MTTIHEDLYSKVKLINIIAEMAIEFFNRDKPKDEKRSGLRLAFTDQSTGEDVLHISVGRFPIEKSDKYFTYAQRKAKFVSGGPWTTLNSGQDDVPQGGVQGSKYGVGASGQLSPHDESICGAIIFIVERSIKNLILRDEIEILETEYLNKLKDLLTDPKRDNGFNELMNYLVLEKNIFGKEGFRELKKLVVV